MTRSFENEATDPSRDLAAVAQHLIETLGEIGTVWQPGDGTRYLLGLTRVTQGSYAGDHVLSIAVSFEAYSVYLPAPYYPDPTIPANVVPWPSTRKHLGELIPILRDKLSPQRIVR